MRKNGFWDKTGTIIEVRPDKLSYLLDVEGKLLIRTGVSDTENIQDQVCPSTFQAFKREKSCSKMCPPNDEVAKLREYRRLDRLNREQMAEEMRLESETNNIQQNAGGFSLVNVQWASFGTGVSAIFVIAIIALAVIICCWLRAKGQRRSKHRHSQLLSAVTSAIVPDPPSSRSHRPERPETPEVSAFEAAKWFRTPSGWASVPGAYLPSPGVVPPQLPFP